MNKFNFKLQKVLEFKTSLEEKKKQEFAEELRRYYNEENKLKELIDKKHHLINNSIKFKTAVEYQNYVRYLNYIDKMIENQTIVLNQVKANVENARNELIKAVKDKNIIEKLKEKAYREFLEEANKKEQALNDDYALHLYLRSEGR
ncbi:flagellar FliJ protein [Caloramator fervidus]|uniref:Flagellar FliJ protein n=1 Tax=Caloramator fervidus TaxID=29344 RepID=A0A1H5SCF0_9CLOT|nr:flagellar export protein FliJ [Caloramator fervidus]SEF48333.1 flagellar FliJ protein [Caloramator fervidus]